MSPEANDSNYLFAQIGVGLSIGFFAGPGWGWWVLVAAAAFSVVNVAARSVKFQLYRASLGRVLGPREAAAFLVMQWVTSAFWIGCVAFLACVFAWNIWPGGRG